MATPGVKTLIRDRFYSVTRQDSPAGPRIVAIARRGTAPGTGGIADLDIVRATNEKDVVDAFGVGSDIHRAYVELVTAGADKVYLVPLPSDTVFNHSSATATSSTFGGDVFDPAFSAAEVSLPDIIVPWGRGGHPDDWEDPATPSNDAEYGFHADNTFITVNNWAYKVAIKVRDISENVYPCVAVMGVRPYMSVSETMTPAQVSSHLTLTNIPDKEDPAWVEYGPYVSIIANEVKLINNRSSEPPSKYGYTNGATHLAATMARTASYVSVYNKPLYNVQSIRYAPTRTQQSALSEKGINSVVVNFNRIPVFSDAVTFAAQASDFVRLSTKRILDEASNVVRQVCQRFIGEPSNIQNRNAMETAITSGLRGMQIMGALMDSDFAVTYVPAENKAIIDLVLTPAFELRSIEVRIAISI
jgi:hypothetical protein